MIETNTQEHWVIDSTKGGNGDLWMRLVSFYAVAKLLPQVSIELLISPFLERLAVHAFGDRIKFNNGNQPFIHYTNLGIRDLIVPILKGTKFTSPYQRSVIRDKKKHTLKDVINAQIFTAADWLGVIQSPHKKWIDRYQGYLDIIGIKKFQNLSYESYLQQLHTDYPIIYNRLQNNFPISPELTIPENFEKQVVVFPTGTGRQFIPLWWAKQYLPYAYYAFFVKDKDAGAFTESGLNVVYFYKEPGDIIKLSHSAKWTVTTDSFPSHVLQTASYKCTAMLTELAESRVVSPAYKGKIVRAVAPCYPCLHLDRTNHPTCAAGFFECLNWRSAKYSNDVVNSIPS